MKSKAFTVLVALCMPALLGGPRPCPDSSGPCRGRHAYPADSEKAGAAVLVGSKSSIGGWLGVYVQDLTPRRARSMDIKSERGAIVNEVLTESPAESAGIREKDVIIEFDGKPIDNSNDLVRAVRKTGPGTTVNIALVRDGERKSVNVDIGKLPRRERRHSCSFSFPEPHRFELFRSSRFLGMYLSDLNEQLGTYFGAPEGKGVLVEKVEKDGSAGKAGFQAGDVIIKVEKESIETTRDIVDVLEDREAGEQVQFEILRKGTGKTLQFVLDEEVRSFRGFYFDMGPRSRMFDHFNQHGFRCECFDDRDDCFMRDLEDFNIDLQQDLQRLEPELNKLKTDLRRIINEVHQGVSKATAKISEKMEDVIS